MTITSTRTEPQIDLTIRPALPTQGTDPVEQLRAAYADRLAAIRNGADPDSLSANAERIRELEQTVHDHSAAGVTLIPDTALFLG
ncbi:hypothetical protein [Angustibacter aerolatus]